VRNGDGDVASQFAGIFKASRKASGAFFPGVGLIVKPAAFTSATAAVSRETASFGRNLVPARHHKTADRWRRLHALHKKPCCRVSHVLITRPTGRVLRTRAPVY